MNRSKIEWCDHTLNPITGCRRNCEYCYARRMVARFSGDVRLNKMAKKDYSMVPAADGGEDLYVLDAPMLNETGNPLVYPLICPYAAPVPAGYSRKAENGKQYFCRRHGGRVRKLGAG